jgi:hypothetical protein
MSRTLPEKAHAGANLVDPLEDALLKLKFLVQILEAFGIDPADADAKRPVAHMVGELYCGIQQTPKAPHRPAAISGRRTAVDDLTLLLDVEWCQSNHNVSDREAISLIAEAFPRRLIASPIGQTDVNSPNPLCRRGTRVRCRAGG